jgi:signal transduction histidine kinase
VELLDRVHQASVHFVASLENRPRAVVEEVVLRVAEEALHNALRHSGASLVEVTLGNTGDRIICEVKDNGVGIDPTGQLGLGLASMRERAARVKGTLEVTSTQASGTTVRLVVPGG